MSKILVSGKGGVGKSFFCVALAKAFERENFKVLLIDADESNQSLYRLLGFEAPVLSYMDYLGGKKVFKERLRKAFQSGTKEPQIEISNENIQGISALPKEILLQRGNIFLLSVGKIKEPLEGCACPMGVLGRELLERFKPLQGEVVIIDTEAGLEHFGRGLEKGVDKIIALSEPYLDALEVAQKILEFAQSMGKPAYLILNKVPEEMKENLSSFLLEWGLNPLLILPWKKEIYLNSLYGKSYEEESILLKLQKIIPEIL
ncbi:ATP-binding protein [Caldimicrobium thiodismutans]|uniref:ATP-binding protein n=1 Tax=Caldimicrobium thiodismutans TaxID=1653476 RepID=A0A0U4W1I7_9BACT|nr:P-loop NTPase [Caldimicrobium thiodismutans]BAU23002.1 ATP-binding protein [Caldimicrobium thiodismutans]